MKYRGINFTETILFPFDMYGTIPQEVIEKINLLRV